MTSWPGCCWWRSACPPATASFSQCWTGQRTEQRCQQMWNVFEGRCRNLNRYKLILDLASKEVITLGSSLAVSAESRVESRSYCVSQEGSQVKLWEFFLFVSWKVVSFMLALRWTRAEHCSVSKSLFTRAVSVIDQKTDGKPDKVCWTFDFID